MAKTIRNQFDKYLTYKNLMRAHRLSRKGKTTKREVILFDLKKEEYIQWLLEQLKTGQYQHGGYRIFKITIPKERVIQASRYMDRVVHRWVVDSFLKPYFETQFISTTYACIKNRGMHMAALDVQKAMKHCKKIWEDYYIVEIVDPETLEPVPEGEIGELVLTTLNREAMPLLRYRTRDLTRILPGECPCGRHHKRLDRMKGRSDDMMILKGVNIFPIQIENILMQFEELGNDYLITLTNEEANDLMTVEVELKEFVDDYPRLQTLTKEIVRRLKDEILITPVVKLLPKGVIPKQEGKAVRVKDLRKTLI